MDFPRAPRSPSPEPCLTNKAALVDAIVRIRRFVAEHPIRALQRHRCRRQPAAALTWRVSFPGEVGKFRNHAMPPLLVHIAVLARERVGAAEPAGTAIRASSAFKRSDIGKPR